MLTNLNSVINIMVPALFTICFLAVGTFADAFSNPFRYSGAPQNEPCCICGQPGSYESFPCSPYEYLNQHRIEEPYEDPYYQNANIVPSQRRVTPLYARRFYGSPIARRYRLSAFPYETRAPNPEKIETDGSPGSLLFSFPNEPRSAPAPVQSRAAQSLLMAY